MKEVNQRQEASGKECTTKLNLLHHRTRTDSSRTGRMVARNEVHAHGHTSHAYVRVRTINISQRATFLRNLLLAASLRLCYHPLLSGRDRSLIQGLMNSVPRLSATPPSAPGKPGSKGSDLSLSLINGGPVGMLIGVVRGYPGEDEELVGPPLNRHGFDLNTE